VGELQPLPPQPHRSPDLHGEDAGGGGQHDGRHLPGSELRVAGGRRRGVAFEQNMAGGEAVRTGVQTRLCTVAAGGGEGSAPLGKKYATPSKYAATARSRAVAGGLLLTMASSMRRYSTVLVLLNACRMLVRLLVLVAAAVPPLLPPLLMLLHARDAWLVASASAPRSAMEGGWHCRAYVSRAGAAAAAARRSEYLAVQHGRRACCHILACRVSMFQRYDAGSWWTGSAGMDFGAVSGAAVVEEIRERYLQCPAHKMSNRIFGKKNPFLSEFPCKKTGF